MSIRVDPVRLEARGSADNAPAIDGRTIRGAIDTEGNHAHGPGIAGHDTKGAPGKKSA